ncbi:MAG: rhodanese-like domain-containing protein [Candidatus Pacebacteria bacterium]|nr:rhodanese-like domain-containing protein [Candidatus Paceibacterota bacterium]
MLNTITTEEVRKKIDAGEDFILTDVLAANSFEARHIPNAKSVPYSTNFLEDFEKTINAAKDADIVVYCASSGCQLSVLAANLLVDAGYSNVSHFVDGLAGWMQAGEKFEGEAV